MGIRLLRLIVILLWFATIIFTIVPSLILWIITNRFYIGELLEWAIIGEWS